MGIAYSAILPAYNEERAIERAVRETAAFFSSLGEPFEIIAVDDGSSDRTAEIAAALAAEFPSLRLVRHESNRGKGEAVRTGVAAAQGARLLFLDCDLATHPREAAAFIAKLGEADIVIGSRRAAGAVIAVRQPWYRVAYGRAINFFIRRCLKLPHLDTQCGFKMFRSEAAKGLFAEMGPSRWTFDAEILLRARAAGHRVAELPVTWSDGGSSRVKIPEVLSDLRYLLRLRRELDAPEPHDPGL